MPQPTGIVCCGKQLLSLSSITEHASSDLHAINILIKLIDQNIQDQEEQEATV
jgi:hypothetical protein